MRSQTFREGTIGLSFALAQVLVWNCRVDQGPFVTCLQGACLTKI